MLQLYASFSSRVKGLFAFWPLLLILVLPLLPIAARAQCKNYFKSYNSSLNYTGFYDSSYSGHKIKISANYGDGDSAVYRGNYIIYGNHRYAYLLHDSTYKACIHISDSVAGCNFDTCYNVLVPEVPCKASLHYRENGRKLQFINASYTGTSYSSQWDFGDGGTSTIENPAHTFGSNGKYVISLKINNTTTGCAATVQDTIYVADTIVQCTASFFYSQNGNSCNFYDNNSYSPNGYTCFWDFGDGGTSTDKTLQYGYSQPSNGHDTVYHVCLTIKDKSGYCTNTYCEDIKIKGDTSCNGDFSDSLVSNNSPQGWVKAVPSHKGRAYTYSWDFGDGYGQTGYLSSSEIHFSYNIKHPYAYDTSYFICMYMKDSKNGCTFSTCKKLKFSYQPCFASIQFNIIDSNKVQFSAYFDGKFDTTGRISSWDFGDGHSSTFAHPVYSFSNIKVPNKICVTLNSTLHKCKASDCKSISFLHKLGGRIYFGSNAHKDSSLKYYKGKVWLIYRNLKDSTLKAVDSSAIKHDANGPYYEFDSVCAGRFFLVKEAIDSNAKAYKNYIPTYWLNSAIWDTAYAISMSSVDVTNDNIIAMPGTNTGGPGFIGGKTSQGANKVGDPATHVEVMLLDASGKGVQYTYSNGEGGFSFSNLAYGTYQVWPEVLGKKTYPVWVTIGPANPTVNNVQMSISSTQVRGMVAGIVQQNPVAEGHVSIYPNPASNNLMLDMNLPTAQHISLSVYDLQGRIVMQKNINASAAQQSISLDISALHAGTYLLRLINEENSPMGQFTFIRQ